VERLEQFLRKSRVGDAGDAPRDKTSQNFRNTFISSTNIDTHFHGSAHLNLDRPPRQTRSDPAYGTARAALPSK
jgi:hypothetical protein